LPQSPYLVVLGTVQDAGSPQLGCTKSCCMDLYEQANKDRKVVSLGLIEPLQHRKYFFDASPDFTSQWHQLAQLDTAGNSLDGIFITHAHIGHYLGLAQLGKEALDARNVPVYAMPRLAQYLEQNGPWSLLVKRENIVLQALENQLTVPISRELSVTPILVPHRDEFSETVGFRINGPNKSALYIPDIDKWSKWDRDIVHELDSVDYAFLDATFFDGAEINHRDISQIPHPFVVESMTLLNNLSAAQKKKVIFIHFNHTNPLLRRDSPESKAVLKSGYRMARIGDTFPL
jgi:pyrroloquinoline quinone biosynthesis protein B